MQVPTDAQNRNQWNLGKYASRGGLKLEGALGDFAINVSGKTCLDIGASTGGFTDCLLSHGARRVYSVDVTTEQMVWRLQQDPRVKQNQGEPREISGPSKSLNRRTW